MSLKPNGHGQHHTSDFFLPRVDEFAGRWRCFLNSSPLCVWGRGMDLHHSASTNMAKIMPC